MAKELKKKEKSKKVKKEKFSVGLKKEMKMVKWPSFKELVKYTIATIIFCIIFVAFFELLSILMAYVKGMFN